MLVQKLDQIHLQPQQQGIGASVVQPLLQIYLQNRTDKFVVENFYEALKKCAQFTRIYNY